MMTNRMFRTMFKRKSCFFLMQRRHRPAVRRPRRAHPRVARDARVHLGDEGRHKVAHVDRLPLVALQNVQGQSGHHKGNRQKIHRS